ncbi:autotransporter outer membrane beta-barrel domain-containing protein [Hyphomicrobium sp.]|uniref:autotransporter outer membrane beta-barrel domain-containing protein n=1 Tax=Hyphomicrobium sp. TaxID=82 RepID=UPI000F901F07|nr:autotransporter outer membrane beta-barrel domain-containing protein [Hyphomicrobium sp.]RUO98128.1 MAG: hypothetical protein EKK30_15550 [Hyphomicrobium sp.]
MPGITTLGQVYNLPHDVPLGTFNSTNNNGIQSNVSNFGVTVQLPSGTTVTYPNFTFSLLGETAHESDTGPSTPAMTVLNCGAGPVPAMGILATSAGGQGGGGHDEFLDAHDGAQGGNGGAVIVENVAGGILGSLSSPGVVAGFGIIATSEGGNGGEGGSSTVASGGNGGMGGNGGSVIVANAGTILTSMSHAPGMTGESIGGQAGPGGDGTPLDWAHAGSGGTGGNSGADVTGVNSGLIATLGNDSSAISVHSVGGNGGAGGSESGLFFALGGTGGRGGNGGTISAGNSGTLVTSGNNSKGISALSIGGGGGDGGAAVAFGPVVSVAIGDGGGGGGYGANVTVANSGTIQTSGTTSYGVRAQSVGGGGGDGGSATVVAATLGADVPVASISVGIGGSGGGGGGSGTVTVINSGVIVTGPGTVLSPDQDPSLTLPGDLSAGIMAQSIGGGGGLGGNAYSVSATADPDGSVSVAVGLGGSGGSGGNGSDVSVTNIGSITTGGREAPGMLVQSVGGGGGGGGNVVSVAAAAGSFALSAPVGVGGSGGTGGDGGNVSVAQDGSITTLAEQSAGLIAQSVGGGGGSGGNVTGVAASVGRTSVSLNVGVGGSGGSGGDSGQTIVNTGVGSTIITAGAQSDGMIVQSVGGGGGNGGSVHSYSFAASGGGSSSSGALAATVAVGGGGGAGGTGDSATLISNGSVVTYGDQSDGALVQSVGGGGGNGGSVFALAVSASLDQSKSGGGSSTTPSISASVAVGGSGGSGNSGGAASFTMGDTSSIQTYGQNSVGVKVQSIGGGGGNGGDAESFAVATAIPNSSSLFDRASDLFINYLSKLRIVTGLPNLVSGQNFQASVSVGGNGGSGGIGGTATANLGAGSIISTSGAHSDALVVQSIGGGGGTGGQSDASGFSGIGAYALNLAVGGQGGSGNQGGTVLIGNNGEAYNDHGYILTSGSQSFGILAQSIGGGGGNAGAAVASNVLLNPTSKLNVGIGIGGEGGTGADGGAVTVSPNLNVFTTGIGSYGIVAQSIGGGGGSGSSATAGGRVNITVGGHGGEAGNGDAVEVNLEGTVATSGIGAVGVVAQSVGGGGGIGGAAGEPSSALLSEVNAAPLAVGLAFGGVGGTGGDGGTVTVNASGATNNIFTTGTTAIGILAQSVGGGGGLSSVVGLNVPIGGQVQLLARGNNGNGNGSGGDVAVSDSTSAKFSIVTSGDGADGIVAQSIGGGGGSAITDLPALATNIDYLGNLTAPLIGSGGDVTVDLNGSITTSGNGAHGIVAESMTNGMSIFQSDGITNLSGQALVGGSTSTGAVSVTIDGSVTTTGSNADGVVTYTNSILAGTTTVNIGGTIAVSGSGAWGIQTNNGNNTGLSASGQATTAITIEPGGVVSAGSASAGAISVNDTLGFGMITIENGGRVTGNISGPEGAGFASPVSVINYGSMTGSVADVSAYFNYGQHFLAVDPQGHASNSINVGSLAAVRNSIIPQLTSLPIGDFAPSTIITAGNLPPDSTASSIGLESGTLSTQYSYAVTSNSVAITGASVDYSRAGLTGNLGHAAALANAQARAISSGAHPNQPNSPLDNFLVAMANTSSAATLQKDLAIFDATKQYSDTQSSATSASNALTNMQSCGGEGADKASLNPVAQGNCDWIRYTYSDGTRQSGGQKERSNGLTFGRQQEFAPHIYLGASGDYDQFEFSGANASSEGSRFAAGGIAKYVDGRLFGSVSMVASYDWADGTRLFNLPEDPSVSSTHIARSNHAAVTVATRLRFGYSFDFNTFDVTPMADIDIPVIHDFGYRERGGGQFDLRSDAVTNVLVDVHPSVQIGSHVQYRGTDIRGYVEPGVRFQELDPTVRVGLADGFDSDFTTTLTDQRDRVVGTIAGGLIIDWSDQLESRLQCERDMGPTSQIQSLSAKAALKF